MEEEDRDAEEEEEEEKKKEDGKKEDSLTVPKTRWKLFFLQAQLLSGLFCWQRTCRLPCFPFIHFYGCRRSPVVPSPG
jgi:hypothetical protein